MAMLHYLIGDATEPMRKPAVIAHVCNDAGKWGAGFVIPLGKKYPHARKEYLELGEYVLGHAQLVIINDDLMIANMIAQQGLYPVNNLPPIRYGALKQCLAHIQQWAEANYMSIHMPRIGAGLAGGQWSQVESIILLTQKVDTYIYTLPNETGLWEPRTYEDPPNTSG